MSFYCGSCCGYLSNKLHPGDHKARCFWHHACRYRVTNTLAFCFTWFVVTSIATTFLESWQLSKSSVSQFLNERSLKYSGIFPQRGNPNASKFHNQTWPNYFNLTTYNTVFLRCVHRKRVKGIIIAHLAVISRRDSKPHLGNHGIVGVSDNTGVDTVSLACLPSSFPGIF